MSPVAQLVSAPWARETRTSDGSSSNRRQRITRFIMKRSLAEVGEKNIMIEIDALDVRRIACESRHYMVCHHMS